MIVPQAIVQLAIPFGLVGGFLLIGVVFERIVLNRLRKLAARTKWQGHEIIISSLRGLTTISFLLLGVYLAMPYIKISAHAIGLLQKFLLVCVIFEAAIIFSRIAVGYVRLYSKKTEAILPSTSIFANLARAVVFVVGGLIILQSLGLPITPILTALGVGGLAVALALQDTLSNLFAGLHILVSRLVRPGDYVKLDTGDEGYIQDITWRHTTIRTLPNNMVIIPNSKLASALVTNYYLPATEMAVLVQVGVSYDSDLENVQKVTIEAAKEVMKEVQGGVSEFEPFIRYHTFADFSINFTVILRAKEYVDQYLLKHEFIKRLHKRYKEQGITIPFPVRTVYLKSAESR